MAKSLFFLGVVLVIAMVHSALASDPDLTTDFNVTNPSAANFTFSGFRSPQSQGRGKTNLIPASFDTTLPGLNGLGLTAVLFEFGAVSQIDPHTHPRATEIFYVLTGQIDVGFVDTNNHLFETTVKTGDIFVFPKGLLHWQRNNQDYTGSGYSVLSSENPGTLSIAEALFTAGHSGLPDVVLGTAFGTSTTQIETIRSAVGTKDNVTIISWGS